MAESQDGSFNLHSYTRGNLACSELSVCWGLESGDSQDQTLSSLSNLTPGVSIGVISQAVSGARWGQWGRQHDPGDAGPGARCQEMLSSRDEASVR